MFNINNDGVKKKKPNTKTPKPKTNQLDTTGRNILFVIHI